MLHHLGYTTVIDASSTDNNIDIPVDWSDSNSGMFVCALLWRKTAGGWGDYIVTESIFSMTIIESIVGLSAGFSRTHKDIWIYLLISISE